MKEERLILKVALNDGQLSICSLDDGRENRHWVKNLNWNMQFTKRRVTNISVRVTDKFKRGDEIEITSIKQEFYVILCNTLTYKSLDNGASW